MLRRYGCSTRQILVDSFPELAKKQGKYTLSILYSGINSSSKTEPVGHWDVRENRHQFLVSFAEKAGFDPMLFDNWTSKLPQIRAYGVTLLLLFGLISHDSMFRVQGYWINMPICMRCWLILFLFKPRSKHELNRTNHIPSTSGISMEGVVMGAGSLLAGRGLLSAIGESSYMF